MEKRTSAVIILSILLIPLLANLVLAQTFDWQSITTPITNVLQRWTANDIVFAKSLFFILILLIVGTIMSRIALFEGKPLISLLVAIVVSILAIWFVPDNIITMATNPYSAMGIAMVSVIPFILMFLFTRWLLTNTFTKKIAWLFFALIMLSLSISSVIKDSGSLYTWAYGIASILAVALIFLNTWVDKAIWKGEIGGRISKEEKKIQERVALDKLKEEEWKARTGS